MHGWGVGPAMRTAALALILFLASATFGAGCGFGGRAVLVVGLYESAAGVVLGAAAAMVCHALRLRPAKAAWPVAALAAAAWLCGWQSADAWAFRQEQAQWLLAQPMQMAQDMAVAGADSPLQLVDAGLRAETGRDGWLGAWLAQFKAGVWVVRTAGMQRAVAMPASGHAAWLGLQAAFVALMIQRALRHQAAQPVCLRCGRYLRRRRLAWVAEPEVDRIKAAWQQGNSGTPFQPAPATAARAELLADTCPHRCEGANQLALVGLRGRQFSARIPGELARFDLAQADARIAVAESAARP